MAATAITRREPTAAGLRRAADRARDARGARRMRAIAMLLEGAGRGAAARACGVDVRTVRRWVRRYEAEGLEGLASRRGPARPRRLSPAQMEALAGWVEAGPEPGRDGAGRWRRRDLQRRIEAAFGVTVHERTVDKLLVELGFRRLRPPPRRPRVESEA